MMRIASTVLFLFFVLCITNAQNQEQNENKVDGLRTGVLSNGLTYYIMKSNLQKGEASFYLVQKVGAIVEENNENGLAHFLEHMAFSGSKHFPNGIMPYMNSQGITKLNAYTSTDETVYNVDDVKVSNPALVDTCIYLLRDWCGNLLLKQEAIDKQRGVITEEWRTHQNVDNRRQKALAPYIFNHSQYSKRDVIGDLHIIQNFKRPLLEKFYQKWYHSDLQGVMIVGDFDLDQMEAKVQRIFGDLVVSKKAKKRIYYTIDDNVDPYYVAFVDPEVKMNKVALYSRELPMKSKDAMANRQTVLIQKIFNGLANQRLVEFRNANEEQFFTADIGYDKLVSNYYVNSVSVVPYPGKDAEALKQVLSVYEHIKRFGFTEKEINEQKNIMFKQLEQAKKSESEFRNSIYINKMKANFLHETPFTSIEDGIDGNTEALLELEPKQVNQWVKAHDLEKNMLIDVDVHDSAHIVLTKQAVLDLCNEVRNSDLKDDVIVNTDTVFMNFKPVAGSIVSIDTLKNYDAEVWHLSNGSKVIYKYTKEGHEHFAFSATSFGGKSLLKANELPSSSALASLATRSGIYIHDKNAMNSMLRGKDMALNMNLTELQEGLSGGASLENAELFFQLTYLFVTHPRFEQADFDNYVLKQNYKLATTVKTPLDLVSDSVHLLTTQPNDRDWKFNEDYLKTMNFDVMKRIFSERFMNNASDFIYYVVGDIKKEQAKDLVCRYVASLPSENNVKEKFVVRDYSVADAKIAKDYTVEMPGNKSMINVSYLNRLNLSNKEKLEFDILVGTLRTRYFQGIRETEGGAYGVNVKPAISDFPENRQKLDISFETQAGKQDQLKPLIYKEIADIQNNGIHQFELEEAVMRMKTIHEEGMAHLNINYWMNVLTNYEERGVDMTSKDRFENYIDTIKTTDVQNLAKRFFSSAKLRDIVVTSQKEEEHYKH